MTETGTPHAFASQFSAGLVASIGGSTTNIGESIREPVLSVLQHGGVGRPT